MYLMRIDLVALIAVIVKIVVWMYIVWKKLALVKILHGINRETVEWLPTSLLVRYEESTVVSPQERDFQVE